MTLIKKHIICLSVLLLVLAVLTPAHISARSFDFSENARFLAPNGMVFRRGEKLRKNYRCHCETNGKSYFVSGLLEVEVL